MEERNGAKLGESDSLNTRRGLGCLAKGKASRQPILLV